MFDDDAAPGAGDRALVVMRVWLSDRPGALGAVASRIGAVGADLVGIEIIERGAGRVVDELTVELPDPELVGLLVSEMHDVEGTDVEDVRELRGSGEDLAVQALRIAAAVQHGTDWQMQAQELVEGAATLLGADWSAMVDMSSVEVLAAAGEDAPDAGWMTGFVRGVTSGWESSGHVVDDLAFSLLPGGAVVLVVGRQRPVLRSRERMLLEALCGLAPRISRSPWSV